MLIALCMASGGKGAFVAIFLHTDILRYACRYTYAMKHVANADSLPYVFTSLVAARQKKAKLNCSNNYFLLLLRCVYLKVEY